MSDKSVQLIEHLKRILENLADYFRTPEGEVFVEIKDNESRKIYPINTSKFMRLFSNTAYQQTGKKFQKNILKEVINIIKDKVIEEGPVREVHFRYAEENNRIFIDIGNKKWQQIVIWDNGWAVTSSLYSPIRFIRKPGMLPLTTVRVENGGRSIKKLKKYINIKNEHEFVLLVAWILGAMNPDITYPILILQGEQGAGKSSAARFLRDLIDPAKVPTRALPSSERDLAISASNTWLLSFDNVSDINDKFSDALCRISTGGGFATRKLYSDNEEILFYNKNPIVMNTIPEDLVKRHDLADRCIPIHLSRIDGKSRKTERVLKKEWATDKIEILRGLYQAVSSGLNNRGKIKFKELPRMADFAVWAMETETGLPWESGKFIEAFEKSRMELIDDAIEADPVADAIMVFMKSHRYWSGTATDLYALLYNIAIGAYVSPSNFPKQPNMLSRHLKSINTFLRAKGVEFERGRSGNMYITLKKMGPPPPPSVMA